MLCESCYLHFLSQAQIYIFWDMNVLIFIWYKCTKLHKKIVYSRVVCYRALIPLKCGLFWCSCLLLMHFGTACFGLGCFLLFEIWEPARIAVILIHIKCPLVQMQMPLDAKSSSVGMLFVFGIFDPGRISVILILTKCLLLQRLRWHCLLWF